MGGFLGLCHGSRRGAGRGNGPSRPQGPGAATSPADARPLPPLPLLPALLAAFRLWPPSSTCFPLFLYPFSRLSPASFNRTLSLFPASALWNAPIPPSPSASPLLPFLLQQQEDSLEKVIKDTESLFKTREKEYQETIDQIEVRPGVCEATTGETPDTGPPPFSCGGGALGPQALAGSDRCGFQSQPCRFQLLRGCVRPLSLFLCQAGS